MVCYIHQCWLCVCICGCVVKGELKLVSSDYNDSYCVQVDDRGAPWSAEDIILFYKLCIWAWPFLLHCSASVIHVKKKKEQLSESFPYFHPTLKANSCTVAQVCMTTVSLQAVMANPTGTELQELSVLDKFTGHKALLYHQEVVGKTRYFGLFSLLETNAFTKQTIRRYPCQVTSLKELGKLGQMCTRPH